MQPITVGVLGVGHLTYHMVPGLLAGETSLTLRLSSRGAEKVRDLRERFGLEICADNETLVGTCDVVIVGVRQFDALEVIRDLPWTSRHTVISCCAGLSLEELRPCVGEASLVRAMPIIAAEHRASPTSIFPDNPIATRVLANCGPVIPLASENDFNAATVTVCYGSLLYGLLARMVEWNRQAGLEPDTARRLVAELTASTAVMARERTDVDLADIVSELASPGSYTLKGFEEMWARDAFEPWADACDKVFAALTE